MSELVEITTVPCQHLSHFEGKIIEITDQGAFKDWQTNEYISFAHNCNGKMTANWGYFLSEIST